MEVQVSVLDSLSNVRLVTLGVPTSVLKVCPYCVNIAPMDSFVPKYRISSHLVYAHEQLALE